MRGHLLCTRKNLGPLCCLPPCQTYSMWSVGYSPHLCLSVFILWFQLFCSETEPREACLIIFDS